MAGILDRLNRNLGQPGMGKALGLLGAHLMAAGAPSFNPGGRAGMIPRGAGAFSDVLRQTSQDAETKRFRDQQIAQMEQVQAERERKSESELAMQRMLLGGQMGGKGAAERSFRGAQDVGTEAVSAPILTDPLLMGMAKANPMAAAAAKLRQDQAETQFGRQKELKGMPLSPEQESQQMRMAGGRAKIKAGLTPQYSGEVFLDKQVGKYYQVNPKTLKREYISPNEEFTIEGSPEGGFSIRKGPQSASGMTKKTLGNIEGKLLSAKEGLARLKGVQQKFRAEYQQIPTRLGAAWTSIKSKLGKDIDPESRVLLEDFASYRQEAIANINNYIKEMTGAAMGEAEAVRLRKAVPDAGTGIADGDDPITFKSKMDNAVTQLEKAQARYRYYLQKGISNKYEMSSKTPLNSMDIAVNPQTGERRIQIEGEWIPL